MGKLAEIVGDGNLKDTINAISIDDHKMSVDEQIEFYIKNKMPFMLHGMSGVGKSRRIKDIDPDYVSIYLRNGMVPEEVIGKTIYPNNDATQIGRWVAPSWYGELCDKCEREKDKVHVLFIDELTNAKETVQSLAYHLVLEHSIAPNMGKLPDNCVVVCAGNSRDESEAANVIPEPLFRRFVAHIYLKPKVPDWLEWGSQIDEDTGHDRVHPVVRAFVSANSSLFSTKYDAEDPPKYALDPRAWEQVSDVIYANNGRIAIEIIENKIGKENAKKFINFAKKYVPISLKDIVSGDYDASKLPTKADEIYAFVLSLVPANNEQVGKVRDFIQANFGNEYLAKYDVAWIGDDYERAILIDGLKKQKEEALKNEKGVKIKEWDEEPSVSEFFKEAKASGDKEALDFLESKFPFEINKFLKGEYPNYRVIRTTNIYKFEALAKVLDSHGFTWKSGDKFANQNLNPYVVLPSVYSSAFITFNINNKNATLNSTEPSRFKTSDVKSIDMVDELTDDDLYTIYGKEIFDSLEDYVTEHYKKHSTQSQSGGSNSSEKTDFKISMDDFVKDDNKKLIAVHNFRQAAIVGKALEKHNRKWIFAWPRGECYWAFNPYNDNAYDAIQNKRGVKPTDTIYYSNQGEYFRDGDTVISNNKYVFDISEVDMSAELSASDQALLDTEIYGDNNSPTNKTFQSNTQTVQASGQPIYKYTIDEFFNNNENLLLQIKISSKDKLAEKFMTEFGKRSGDPQFFRDAKKIVAQNEGDVLNCFNFDIHHYEIIMRNHRLAFEKEDIDFSKYLTEKELMVLYDNKLPTTYKLTFDKFLKSYNNFLSIKVTGVYQKELVKKAFEKSGEYLDYINFGTDSSPALFTTVMLPNYEKTCYLSDIYHYDYQKSKLLGAEDIDMSSIPELQDAYNKYMAKNGYDYNNKPIDYQEIYKSM